MTAHEKSDPVSLAGIGACAAFLAVVEQARELARIPRPILIRGERGTGKELLARFVHAASPRRGGPYLHRELRRLPGRAARLPPLRAREGVLHRRDRAARRGLRAGPPAAPSSSTRSRTSAATPRRGCTGWSSTRRSSGSAARAEIEVDVRVVAATNADLGAMIERGDFMVDLYDRLRFAEIVLPPLRQRPRGRAPPRRPLHRAAPRGAARPRRGPLHRGGDEGARRLRLAGQRPRAQERDRAPLRVRPRPHHPGLGAAARGHDDRSRSAAASPRGCGRSRRRSWRTPSRTRAATRGRRRRSSA